MEPELKVLSHYLKIVTIYLNFVIKRLTGIVFLHCKIMAQLNDAKNRFICFYPFVGYLFICFTKDGASHFSIDVSGLGIQV